MLPHKKGKSSRYIFIYEDQKTGEIYQFSRKGIYKKNGRTLLFVKKSKGNTMTDRDFIKDADKFIQEKTSPTKKQGIPLIATRVM